MGGKCVYMSFVRVFPVGILLYFHFYPEEFDYRGKQFTLRFRGA